MARRVARDFRRRALSLHRISSPVRFGIDGRDCGRTGIRQHWICIHDFCGAAGGTQENARLPLWPSANLDARAPVARPPELADHFVSLRIPVRPWLDGVVDDAADHRGLERRLWSGSAALYAAGDDARSDHGNYL